VKHGLVGRGFTIGSGMEKHIILQRLAADRFDHLPVPTGMHGPQSAQIQEHRQPPHPLQPLRPFVRSIGELLQGHCDSAVLFEVPRTQPAALAVRSVVVIFENATLMASSSSSGVRASRLRNTALILLHIFSIGLRSGE